MNLKVLEYVVEIARCGSINKAAQNLYLSQPAMSGSLKHLEEELGFTIFRRHKSGVELTPEGILLVESAQEILRQAEKIRRIPSLFSRDDNLSISCTYSSVFMHSFMSFRRHAKADMNDVFKETGMLQMQNDVAMEHRYRLSLFYCFSCRREKHQHFAQAYGMQLEPLATDFPVVAIASKRNLLARKGFIRYPEIACTHFVTYENFEYDDWLEVLGFSDGHKSLLVFDRGGLLDTVAQSDYVAVIMKCPAEELERAGCVMLPILDFGMGLDIFLMRHRDYVLNPREKQFVQALRRDLGAYLS